jgi:WD40 repeat protein
MRSFITVLLLVFVGPWSVASAQQVSIKQTKELKNALAVSADFKLFAEKVKTGKDSYDYAVKVKEMGSGKEVKSLEWDKEWGELDDASFSPDGKKLAILCGKLGDVKTAKVFDLASAEMKFNVRHTQMKFVAFTPDSKQLASAGGFGAASPKEALWIWDVETKKKIVTECPTTPTCIALSPDGKLVVAAHGTYGGPPPLLTTCQVATGERAVTFKREGKEDVVAVAFSTDSKLIAAGTRDGTIKLYDAAEGKEVASFDDIQDEIFSVAFHPKENLLAGTGKDKTIRFWNLESKKLVSTTKLPNLEYYLRLQFSTDGTQLATYTPRGNIIKLWSVEVKK